MSTIDISQTAAAVIARARSNSGLTAPEFDYDIAVHFAESVNGIGGEFGTLGNANHEIAREHSVDPAEQWAALQTELTTYAEKCRNRKYTGWSAASRSRGARISYAN